MTMNFFEAVKNRRTYYSISKKSPVSDEIGRASCRERV